ncbi:hypothetical protein [Bacillus sp. T33-2]|uniref:hypothetical protein n=1 Tax=Bacillus sp. T33-2 TaxID=2054168 RepID=UPI000C7940F7|nr:hypothetical protein [Bacillus sp. T33-2]PLR93227.1 hypothetical protein CVD19_19685 [Bacillus sp. T33-2]
MADFQINCVMCDKQITRKEFENNDYVTGESLGEYWCRSCAEDEKPISICTNSNCENPIYKGDHVWQKGSDLYCQLKCLVDSLYGTKEG